MLGSPPFQPTSIPMRASFNVLRYVPATVAAQIHPYRLTPGNDPDDEPPRPVRFDRTNAKHEDLPYKVELWDEAKKSVEQVLAVTASGSIGYAAYYAATREYPQRYITLRHKNSVVARWNGPEH
jgi:hypothetical protein